MRATESDVAEERLIQYTHSKIYGPEGTLQEAYICCMGKSSLCIPQLSKRAHCLQGMISLRERLRLISAPLDISDTVDTAVAIAARITHMTQLQRDGSPSPTLLEETAQDLAKRVEGLQNTPRQRLLIPCGWRNCSSSGPSVLGHTLLLELQYDSIAQTYTLTVINTGEGRQWHALHWSPFDPNRDLCYTELSANQLDCAFWVEILQIASGARHPFRGAEDFYKHLQVLDSGYNRRLGAPCPAQQRPICAYKVAQVWAKRVLGPDLYHPMKRKHRRRIVQRLRHDPKAMTARLNTIRAVAHRSASSWTDLVQFFRKCETERLTGDALYQSILLECIASST
ncbi:MAG: hypothetical protein KDK78_04820 [Chlamydiia bacterium]|nr:hypothetical protein [Chlamydiia bacterium]